MMFNFKEESVNRQNNLLLQSGGKMTDPPFGGGGGGGGDGDEGGGGGLLPAPGDLGFGLGDLDTSSLSHADRVQLECAFLQQTWAPPPGEADPAARFCPPFSGTTTS